MYISCFASSNLTNSQFLAKDTNLLCPLGFTNVSFPALFSRNYLSDLGYNSLNFSGNFIEDDYLLVFIENFQKIMKSKQLRQIEIYGATDIQPALISRLVNRKALNPTIKTLYAMAYTIDVEMYNLFLRSSIKEDI